MSNKKEKNHYIWTQLSGFFFFPPDLSTLRKGLILFHSLCAPRTQDPVRLCGHLLNERMSPHHCLWRRVAEHTCYVSRSCLFLFCVSQGRPGKRSAGNNSRISHLHTFVFLCLQWYKAESSVCPCCKLIQVWKKESNFSIQNDLWYTKLNFLLKRQRTSQNSMPMCTQSSQQSLSPSSSCYGQPISGRLWTCTKWLGLELRPQASLTWSLCDSLNFSWASIYIFCWTWWMRHDPLISQGCWEVGTTEWRHFKAQGLCWWLRGEEAACQCGGHGLDPWSGTIPHATGQQSPWATTTEPVL